MSKVKLEIIDSKVTLIKDGTRIKVDILENVRIRQRSATITITFDELKVRSENHETREVQQQED